MQNPQHASNSPFDVFIVLAQGQVLPLQVHCTANLATAFSICIRHLQQLQVSLLDSVQDIRQFLLETTESCFLTSYHLVLDGAIVNDYAELLEIEGVKEGSVFYLVQGNAVAI